VLLPEFPNFEAVVDSPLSVEATNVFHKNVSDCFDDEALALVNQGINPIKFPGLNVSVTSDDSKMINFNPNPKVIISASGMCEAGRIRHHLKHNLWRAECTVLFVGYQSVGTLGRKLIEGASVVKLFGENIEVAANIETLKGISGHADKNGLLEWLGGFETPVQHVFVVHGEDAVTDQFAQTVTETFGWNAFAPYSGGCVDLATNTILTNGIPTAKKKVQKPTKVRSENAFNRLVLACKRLMTVVMKCEGMANKDLAKFEGQIQNLVDKWDVKD